MTARRLLPQIWNQRQLTLMWPQEPKLRPRLKHISSGTKDRTLKAQLLSRRLNRWLAMRQAAHLRQELKLLLSNAIILQAM